MKLLLDTCTFLWLSLDPDKLSDKVRESYRDEDNVIFFSVVSIWEIAIKHRLGKTAFLTILNGMSRFASRVTG